MNLRGISLGAVSEADGGVPTSPAAGSSCPAGESAKFWHRLFLIGPRRTKRLRLCETLPLGDHRFVAVIEFEQMRFLIGGTSASLSLLAHLDARAVAISPKETERLSEPGGSR